MSAPKKENDPKMDWGFHAVIPRIVRTEYKNVSPLQKWIYVCLKDLCGEAGTCFRTIRVLSQEIGLSSGMTSETIRVLHEAGLIHAEKKRRHTGGKEVWHITIIDIWKKNGLTHPTKRSPAEQECSQDEQTTTNKNVHRMNVRTVNKKQQECSQDEQECSHSETEEESLSRIITEAESKDTLDVSACASTSTHTPLLENVDDLKDSVDGAYEHLTGKSPVEAAKEDSYSLTQQQATNSSEEERTQHATTHPDQRGHHSQSISAGLPTDVHRGSGPDKSVPPDNHRISEQLHKGPVQPSAGSQGHNQASERMNHEDVTQNHTTLQRGHGAVQSGAARVGASAQDTPAGVAETTGKGSKRSKKPVEIPELTEADRARIEAEKAQAEALKERHKGIYTRIVAKRGYELTEQKDIIVEWTHVHKLANKFNDSQIEALHTYLFERDWKYSKPDNKFSVGAYIIWKESARVAQILKEERQKNGSAHAASTTSTNGVTSFAQRNRELAAKYGAASGK